MLYLCLQVDELVHIFYFILLIFFTLGVITLPKSKVTLLLGMIFKNETNTYAINNYVILKLGISHDFVQPLHPSTHSCDDCSLQSIFP